MKKYIVFLCVIICLLGLVACSAQPSDNTHRNDNLVNLDEEAKKAYVDVLKRLYNEHLLLNADGEGDFKIEDNNFSKISDNKFAIYDVDLDGQEELIIQITTSSTAGMIEIIYDYDNEVEVIRTQFTEWPALTYYDNGIVMAKLSNNQGLGVDIENFWPYTIYQYEVKTDSYLAVGRVDAWNKAYRDEDFDGNPFPNDADKDGDGVVYYVDEDYDYRNDLPIDFAEYEKWLNAYIGDAKEVDIPYLQLTLENIDKQK